jgi:hypothetical protein
LTADSDHAKVEAMKTYRVVLRKIIPIYLEISHDGPDTLDTGARLMLETAARELADRITTDVFTGEHDINHWSTELPGGFDPGKCEPIERLSELVDIIVDIDAGTY